MCTCASCEYTDGFEVKGFAEWPRGNPAGRKSAASYAAHVKYGQQWGKGRVPAISRAEPKGGSGRAVDPGAWRSYPTEADAKLGTAHYVAQFIAANSYAVQKREAAEAAPARPDQPGKADPHLPAVNRHGEPERGILYAMKQGKAQFMTVPQAAAKLECSESRILQWIREERLPAIKPARDWLIPTNAKRPEELPRGRPKAKAA